MSSSTPDDRTDVIDQAIDMISRAVGDILLAPIWGTRMGACMCRKGANCATPGKHGPGSWKDIRTHDVATIEAFLHDADTPNYAASPTKGYVIADVDGDDIMPFMAWAKATGIPLTFTVETANGYHYYFKLPEGWTEAPARLFYGDGKSVILRSDAHPGYVIGPGSVHATGKVYRVSQDSDIATLPVEVLRLSAKMSKAPKATSSETVITVKGDKDLSSMREGSGRNNVLRDKARLFYGGGLTGQALFDAVNAVNKQFGVPYGEDKVTQAIWKVEQKFDQDPLPGTPEAEAKREQYKEQKREEEAKAEEEQAEQAAHEHLLGARTAADLTFGATPDPLLDTFFTTTGSLILYGPGGVGKGTMACYLIGLYLTSQPDAAYILDFEGHENEWGRRLRGIGLTENQLLRVHYREPFGMDWKAKQSTIAKAGVLIRAEMDELRVGFVVIDSVVMASEGDAQMGGVESARGFFAGLAQMGRRSLSIGHVAGGSERWPAKPFGSTYIHNLARETWAIERVGDVDSEMFSSSFQVELRNRKNSEGRLQPRATYDITHHVNGDLDVVKAAPGGGVRDWVEGVLAATPGLSAAAIVKGVKEDTGETVTEKQVQKVFENDGGKTFVKSGIKRPFVWSLKPSEEND